MRRQKHVELLILNGVTWRWLRRQRRWNRWQQRVGRRRWRRRLRLWEGGRGGEWRWWRRRGHHRRLFLLRRSKRVIEFCQRSCSYVILNRLPNRRFLQIVIIIGEQLILAFWSNGRDNRCVNFFILVAPCNSHLSRIIFDLTKFKEISKFC